MVEISHDQIGGNLSIKATQKVYEKCVFNQKGGVKLNLSLSNLQPLDFSTPPTLSALLNSFFTPLQPYQAIAASLYGTDIVEPTGEVEYPLWQIRQAYLKTTRWSQTFDKTLAAATRSSHTIKSDEEIAVELAIAKVLKHTLAYPKEGLNDYSGDSDSLDALITWVTQITPHQQMPPHHADSLIYALSLLITLGLRDLNQRPLRMQILSFLKGEKVIFSFNVKNKTHTTTELILNPQLIVCDLMFIDFRYSCWSGLDLDGLKFSGADFTHAKFVNSSNLTEARYCLFDQINDTKMKLKPGADLKGTYPPRVNDLNQHVSCYYFWGLSYLLQSTHLNKRAKRSEKLVAAYRKLTHIKGHLKEDKGFMLTLHLATIAMQQRKPKKALNLLFTAWNLNTNALKTILNPKPDNSPHYLNLLGWDAFKEKLRRVITQKQLRGFYTQLSEERLAKNYMENKALKSTQLNESILEYATSPTEDIRRKNYLEFIETFWPNEITLYEDLCNHPNPCGYRQSERIAYETLTASIQRLCVPPQSDDNKSLDTEHVNQNKDLPSIEIRGHSVGNQKLLPSIVQQLIEYKLFDVDTDKFKPPLKKKTKKQTEAIKSQHRVICIDCDSNGVYISSEPDIPRQTDKLEPGYVSLHLKIHPDLPMMDYTTDIFNRRLIGHGSPANEFVVLTIIHQAKDNQPAYDKRYPVLISQTVEGMNLKHVLAKHPEQLERLDNKSTSEFFIAEVLKHPGDGFSRNYVIKQRSATTTQIVSVDNSQIFVEPIVKTSDLLRQKHKELQERSIIYCIPQITKTPLDKRALNTITAIRDVTKLLTAWLNTVAAREAHYTAFLTKGDIMQWNAQREKNNPFIPHALFRRGAVSLLAMQLRYLQSLFRFREQHSKKIIIKPTLVMNKLNPRLLNYYKTMRKESGHQALTSEAAFKKATGAVQSMSSSEAKKAILGDIPDSAFIQQQFDERKETAKMESLVHKALEELNYLGERLLADLKGKQAFNITDEGDWELRVDFQPPKEKSSKKLSSVRRRTHANKAETSNKADKDKTQPVTAKLQNPKDGQKQWLNTFLVKKATFKTLVLSHCIGLDDATLVGLIKNSQHLEHLDITGCKQITQETLRDLTKYCKELRILKASRTGIVDATSKTGFFQSSRLLLFPKLNKLHLGGYAREKLNQPIIRLTRVALDAPELETLKVNNNRFLRSVELPSSNKLKYLNLKEDEQLTQLTIPAEAQLITLNLADCKQLTDEQITFDSRLLTTLEIGGCSQLVHGDFRQNYPTFFTALPWQHYTESFVKKLSITLQKMLMTNNKTDEWNKLPPQTSKVLYKTLYKWGGFGQKTISTLIKASTDIPSFIHCTTTQALGQCAEHNPSAAITQLGKALKNNSSDVREAAAKALGQCAEYISSAAITQLGNALADNSLNVRFAAAQALEQCAEHVPSDVITQLGQALKNNSSDVREVAAQALGQCAEYISSAAITQLGNALADNNLNVRFAAAKALGQCAKHNPSAAITQLGKALMDKDSWGVRHAAAKALGQCAEHISSAAITQLGKALMDKDSWSVREAAAKALGQCAGHVSSAVITQFGKALMDNSSDVRRAAAKALGQCAKHNPSAAITQLGKALKNNSSDVREAAAKALGQCAKHNPSDVITQLGKTLMDNSSDVRRAAAKALGQCAKHNPSAAITQLGKALKNNSSDVRETAAKALGQCAKHNPSDVITQLGKTLMDNSSDVRRAAAKALGQCAKHNPSAAITQLGKALKNNSSDVRRAVVQALGQCAKHNPSDVITQLGKALIDNISYVREAAAQALEQCAEHVPSDVITQLGKALMDKDSRNVRLAAAQALGQCAEHVSSDVITQLGNALADDSLNVRRAATQALEQCAEHVPSDVITQFGKALMDNSSDVRRAAAQALGQCAEHVSSDVITQLGKALMDKDSWNVRKAAAQALGQCAKYNPSAAITQLGKALMDNSSDVREAAAQGLGQYAKYNPSAAITQLGKALMDNSSDVRRAAAQALGQCAEHVSSTAITQLGKALMDNSSDVREAAAQALGQCAEHVSSAAITQLGKALMDNSSDVCRAAAQALEQCAEHVSSDVITQLGKALMDKDSRSVRLAAAQALGTIGSVDTLQSWIENVLNENKVNLESKNTFEQQPTSDNVTLYTSVITQPASSPCAELPPHYDNSQNKSERGEKNESTYCNNEI